MNRDGEHTPLRQADDPSDPVWHWLLRNGPHGAEFRWEGGGLRRLRRFIEDLTDGDPDFPAKARAVALAALSHENPAIVRRAIQVLAVVGSDEDMTGVMTLLDDPDEDVVKDARCCLFERGFKGRRVANPSAP